MLVGFFLVCCLLIKKMKISTVEEIIACLPQGRTIFPYYRDRYAALLLGWVLHQRTAIADIKRSRYAPLLKKPAISKVLEHCGDGTLSERELDMAWAEPNDQYLLTLTSWGNTDRSWQQTSRPGANLVLQLNLTDSYRRVIEKLFGDADYFQFDGHPVRQKSVDKFYRPTLGWVRMDIDLGTNAVLIEEIQSDMFRDLKYEAGYLRKRKTQLCWLEQQQLEFCDLMITQHGKLWTEALLSAALWFIHEELGLKEIWYHSFETGSRLKRIRHNHPPRSLYTALPRKFYFERTSEHPEFLSLDGSFRRDRRRFPNIEFYRLRLRQ